MSPEYFQSNGDPYVEILNKIMDRLKGMEDKLDGHMQREEGALLGVAEAFPSRPDGQPDYAGHREYHAALIDEARERRALFRELRKELLKKSLWGLIAVVGALIAFWWHHSVKAGGSP